MNIPESYRQWQDIDECIDLEDTEEEYSEVLKGFGEEVPEETKVGRLVRYSKAARYAQHTITQYTCTCINVLSDNYSHDAINSFQKVPRTGQFFRDNKEKGTPHQLKEKEFCNTSNFGLL